MPWSALLLIVPLVACAAARAPAAVPAGAEPPAADVMIDIKPQSVRLRVGDVLVATSTGRTWRATFDDSALEAISPTGEDAVSNQWRLRARTAGATEITFTGDVSAPCPTPPNCPPPPAPLTVVVEVQVSQQDNND